MFNDLNFEFTDRHSCPCGASLEQSHSCVTKETELGQVRFVLCPDCGSFIQSPMLTPTSLAAWYDSDAYQGGGARQGSAYIDYAKDEDQRIHEARGRYLRDLAPHLPPHAQVLEIGCASASILAEVQRHGHYPLGCDLSPRFAELSRSRHGISVQVSDYLDMDIPAASLDAVLLFGTISNMQNLYDSVVRMHRHLKPSGFVLLNFPAADSMMASLYGHKYWMYAPSVMQFLTRRGILKVLDRANFSVEWIGHDRQAPSVSKVLAHAGLSGLHGIANKLGLLNKVLPSLLIPGVFAVRTRPKS